MTKSGKLEKISVQPIGISEIRGVCIGVSLLIETFAKSGILTELEESTGFFLGNSKMRPLQLMYDLQTPAGWQF